MIKSWDRQIEAKVKEGKVPLASLGGVDLPPRLPQTLQIPRSAPGDKGVYALLRATSPASYAPATDSDASLRSRGWFTEACGMLPLFPIGRYPHSLLYRVDGGTIRISAVAAHARRPQYWQQRKP